AAPQVFFAARQPGGPGEQFGPLPPPDGAAGAARRRIGRRAAGQGPHLPRAGGRVAALRGSGSGVRRRLHRNDRGETQMMHPGPCSPSFSPQRRRDAETSAEKDHSSEDLRTSIHAPREERLSSPLSVGFVFAFSALISASLRLCGEWHSRVETEARPK